MPRRQRGTPSDACATGIRRPAARRFGICPGVLCRVPCTENCLTKRSSSGRTHGEHEGRSDPRVPDRRWVSCRLVGEHWQVKHDVAPEKCALSQKLVLYPLACNREQGTLSDDALAIVHLHCVLPSCFEPRETHRVDLRLNVSPIVFVIIQSGNRCTLLTKSHQC